MLKRYQSLIGGTFKLVDASVIGAAWVMSYGLRFYVPIIPITKGFPPFEKYLALLPLVVLIWVLTLSAMSVYQPGKLLRRTEEAQLVLRGHFTALALFAAMTFLFTEYQYSRAVMAYFGTLGATFLVLSRVLIRNTLRGLARKGHFTVQALAIGEGESLEHFIWRLRRFPELGAQVTAIVCDDPAIAEKYGIRRVGSLKALEQGIHALDFRTAEFGQVVIALPRSHADKLDTILGVLRDETLDIRVIPDIREYITLGCAVEDFDGLPLINLNDSPLRGWGAALKRLTDIVLSFLALVLLSPLLLVLGFLVKLTSRGPVFYGQERMGLDGSTFTMYKFRSMRADAEGSGTAGWTTENDPRRTRFGSFLRATSLDELPQFWNVLRGDMSLVGPRPERPVYVGKFRGEIPHYMLRHKVKAGITGWAQVNGWRGNTSLEKRIEYDLFYIRNWSYLMDIKILALTLLKGFINKNAY